MTTPTSAAAEKGFQGGVAPALETVRLTKAFGSFTANDSISMKIEAGTIHAILGENGAGKTTLMRMIYGLYTPDSGTILLNGEPVRFRGPRDALERGVAMVHQTSLLVGSMTVAQNVMLSEPVFGSSSHREVVAKLTEISERIGLGLDPKARVDTLSVGQRQRAEILAALYHEASLIILDEPTTVLTPKEADQLFAVMRELADAGSTIILITHKLREVLAITDDATVLRAGRVVGSARTKDLDEPTIVRLMVGKDVPATVGTPSDQETESGSTPARDCMISVEHLNVDDLSGVQRVKDVSLSGYAGEIVGITGVEGNGQRDLIAALMGLQRARNGRVALKGRDVTSSSVGRRRRLGLGYIPESRATEGIAASLSLVDNLMLGQEENSRFSRWGLRRMRASRDFSDAQIAQFAIATRGAETPVGTLSGGNAQKVVVAREVAKQPSVLIAVQPTQGVDVAAAHSIRTTLKGLRDEGMCILLVTSDLSEACDLSDRIVVLYNGRVAGEVSRANASESSLGRLAMGLAS
ncbi:ABC transporter ATP-binding protein [Leifsonia sp. NPDC056665]|uniref:ABC transporter ATP-binding protein n=1 Tax=Leifsonia sp. NPDC056665 TaxID=3345901 RepID=UPI0036B83383